MAKINNHVINNRALQQPEAYIGNVAQLFDQEGKLNNLSTKEFLVKFLQAFDSFINQISRL